MNGESAGPLAMYMTSLRDFRVDEGTISSPSSAIAEGSEFTFVQEAIEDAPVRNLCIFYVRVGP